MRKKIFLVAILVLAGLVRLPIEAAFQRQVENAGLGERDIGLPMREQLGQAGFVAVLGGFRSLVASILSLEAYTAWEKREWGKVDSLYEVITSLQPGIAAYWDAAGWHMAYNAASDSANSSLLSAAARKQLYDEYVAKGVAYLEGGIKNLPDDPRIPAALAEIYRKRVDPPDYEKAADYYGLTSELPGAKPFYERFRYIALAKVPGREREAYENLRRLYLEDERNRKPTLISELGRLEEKFVVPADERVAPAPEEPADENP